LRASTPDDVLAKSAKEMDLLGMHPDAFIRSGARMADDSGLLVFDQLQKEQAAFRNAGVKPRLVRVPELSVPARAAPPASRSATRVLARARDCHWKRRGNKRRQKTVA
jgi:hypothetical protein